MDNAAGYGVEIVVDVKLASHYAGLSMGVQCCYLSRHVLHNLTDAYAFVVRQAGGMNHTAFVPHQPEVDSVEQHTGEGRVDKEGALAAIFFLYVAGVGWFYGVLSCVDLFAELGSSARVLNVG